MEEMELKFLKQLAKQYPTIAAASTEIINLQSILNLPNGTEHFLTDIHGEYEQFNHVLKNGSGAIRRKIDEEFGNTLSEKDKKALATLIYYPEEKLALISKEEENLDDWYKITLHRLVQITKRVSSKYTRSKVRKALPKDFAYVIEELITEKAEVQDISSVPLRTGIPTTSKRSTSDLTMVRTRSMSWIIRSRMTLTSVPRRGMPGRAGGYFARR